MTDCEEDGCCFVEKGKGQIQAAIIRHVQVGLVDQVGASLSFDTLISEVVGARQMVSWEDAKGIIEILGLKDINDLEGKPCKVRVFDGGRIEFMRVWGMPYSWTPKGAT